MRHDVYYGEIACNGGDEPYSKAEALTESTLWESRMSFRSRSIAAMLLVSMMSLLATVVGVSPAVASPAPPRHMIRLPVDDKWHTSKFTMQSTMTLASHAAELHCKPTTKVQFSFRLRGRAKGYDIAFFKMTNRGTFTLGTGKLGGLNYRWLPSADLKPNWTGEVVDLGGHPYAAGSQTWGRSLMVSVVPNGKSSLCVYEFIIGAAKAG